ncbi:MAG: single-stranded DNA-binding protein [Spirochaetes bacterium]|nr:single-stranded DNA-binding protein [Spirochaetota bacterium]
MQPFNMVIIEGNLLSEPKTKNNSNGKPFVLLKIISNHFYKEDNKWVNDPTIITVHCYGNLKDLTLNSLKKGEKIIVYGKLKFFTTQIESKKLPYFYLLASKIEKFDKGTKVILEETQKIGIQQEKIPA